MTCDFNRSLAAVGELLEFVDEFVLEHALDDRTAFATRLVVEELFANLVRHNEGGIDRVEVELELVEGVMTVRLRDFEVRPFDIKGRGPVDVSLPLSERAAGGLGLHFIQNFFDDLAYSHSEGTMTVTATKRIGRRDV